MSTQFRDEIRKFELQATLSYFPPNAKVLEIGGGNGFQALLLSKMGFDVSSIDLPNSAHPLRFYPVVDYDGIAFPFANQSFDVLFSSNTLEHVVNQDDLLAECNRVLRPGGISIHIVPTTSWRFWTSVSNYAELLKRLTLHVRRLNFLGIIETFYFFSFPARHGESGNSLTELWVFSDRVWRKKFLRHFSALLYSKNLGVFYSGHCILKKLSVSKRAFLAKFLGSSTRVYIGAKT